MEASLGSYSNDCMIGASRPKQKIWFCKSCLNGTAPLFRLPLMRTAQTTSLWTFLSTCIPLSPASIWKWNESTVHCAVVITSRRCAQLYALYRKRRIKLQNLEPLFELDRRSAEAKHQGRQRARLSTPGLRQLVEPWKRNSSSGKSFLLVNTAGVGCRDWFLLRLGIRDTACRRLIPLGHDVSASCSPPVPKEVLWNLAYGISNL